MVSSPLDLRVIESTEDVGATRKSIGSLRMHSFELLMAADYLRRTNSKRNRLDGEDGIPSDLPFGMWLARP